MTGKLETYENNTMSLSCHGSMIIESGTVKQVHFSGYPRTHGDGWTNFYKSYIVGDKITQDEINKVLQYNGLNNVVSIFRKEK